jgi:hypothetical protein
MRDILAARDFGAVFAFLRARGWSVGALSQAVGIDEYPIREIIKGNREVGRYDVIERIVVGLGIDRHLCGIGTGPAGDVSVDGWDEFGQMLGRAKAVDGDVLDLLAEQTDHIRRVDRMLGADAAAAQLEPHMAALMSLRAFSIRPVIRQRLAALICDASALAGWVALDRGEVAAAWHYHEAAKDAGRETGSTTALAHALAQQAYVLHDAGRTAEAGELAGYALETAGTAVPPLLIAWLTAVVGELAALVGDGDACRRAFDTAVRLLPAESVNGDLPFIMLDAFHLARWQGTAFARLGDPAAIAQLEYALDGMDTTFVRARAQLHIELSRSLHTAGDVAGARTQVGRARELAGVVCSVRQQRRIRQLELVLGEAA